MQFLEVIDTPVVFVTTGACVGPDSAEFVESWQVWTRLLVCRWCAETADAPQLQFIDSLVHAPAVMQRLLPMVHTVQLGLRRGQLIFLMMSFGYFLRPCTQVQGPKNTHGSSYFVQEAYGILLFAFAQ